MKSRVSKISDKQSSLRTIIPKSVVELLQLEHDTHLNWQPEVKDGKIQFYVTRWEDDQTEKETEKET